MSDDYSGGLPRCVSGSKKKSDDYHLFVFVTIVEQCNDSIDCKF